MIYFVIYMTFLGCISLMEKVYELRLKKNSYNYYKQVCIKNYTLFSFYIYTVEPLNMDTFGTKLKCPDYPCVHISVFFIETC